MQVFGSLALSLLLTLPAMAQKARPKKDIDQEQALHAQAFYENLPAETASSLDQLILQIQNSPYALNRISNEISLGNTPIYLLIQGLDFSAPTLWEALHILRQAKATSYFLSWSKKDDIEANIDKVKKGILALLQTYPQQQIVVFGFSAGGVLAIKVWDDFMLELSQEQLSHLTLRNVVAVPHGYGAPKISKVANSFVGKTTIAMGIGIEDQLKNLPLKRCEEWITTNGNLDIHARPNKDGRSPQQLQSPACGAGHRHELPEESHFSALHRILTDSLSEDIAELSK